MDELIPFLVLPLSACLPFFVVLFFFRLSVSAFNKFKLTETLDIMIDKVDISRPGLPV